MRRLIPLAILVLGLAVSAPMAVSTAQAQGEAGPKAGKQKTRDDKVKVFDFTGLDVSGQLRAPQLLYFLDRASEELKRASLERRSFIPEMVRSLEEEAL